MSKNVLITGAGGNLGRVVSQRLAAAGFSLDLAIYKDKDLHLPNETDVKFHKTDLEDESATNELVSSVLEDRSNIDLAVLIAGGFMPGGLTEVSMEDIQKMIDLNFATAYNVVKPLIGHYKSSGKQGQIILISARPGLDPKEGKNLMAYGLSKSMLVYLSEAINAEFKGTISTSTVIAPSTLDTQANREAMPDADFASWVTPDEIADTILHVASPAGLKLRNTILQLYGNA
jgi:NAD(P)-dependent dehydrogenase (short-subunit alcohol dehydrogenase family)